MRLRLKNKLCPKLRADDGHINFPVNFRPEGCRLFYFAGEGIYL